MIRPGQPTTCEDNTLSGAMESGVEWDIERESCVALLAFGCGHPHQRTGHGIQGKGRPVANDYNFFPSVRSGEGGL